MRTSSAAGSRPARTPGGRAKVIRLSSRRTARRWRRLKAGAGLFALVIGAGVTVRFYLRHWVAPFSSETAALGEPGSELFQLVNQERVRRGINPLRLSIRLAMVARGRSREMAVGRSRYHKIGANTGLVDQLKSAGISCKKAAENTYVGKGDMRGVAGRAIKGWLESREHRALLLSPDFDRTGVGIVRSSDGRIYITEELVH